MKNWTLIIIAVLGLFISSCGKKTAVQEPTIAEDKFVDVLTDVRLLEGYYSIKFQSVDSQAGKLSSYYQHLFDRHGITQQQFEENYRIYFMDFDRMNRIEDSVMAHLDRMPRKSE
jgi:Domain of unknown function (DUF4296)